MEPNTLKPRPEPMPRSKAEALMGRLPEWVKYYGGPADPFFVVKKEWVVEEAEGGFVVMEHRTVMPRKDTQ